MNTANSSFAWNNYPLIKTWELYEQHLHSKRQNRYIKVRRDTEKVFHGTPPRCTDPAQKRDHKIWHFHLKGLCYTSYTLTQGWHREDKLFICLVYKINRDWVQENHRILRNKDSTLEGCMNRPCNPVVQCQTNRGKIVNTKCKGSALPHFKGTYSF